MKNVDAVRKGLSKIWEDLESGATDAKMASEFANIAGKMINSAKVQMEYMAIRKDDRKIKFLEPAEDES